MKINLKWVTIAVLAVVGVVAFAFMFKSTETLAAPSFAVTRGSFSPAVGVVGRQSVAADATYVMWKGAKKKMMKRPKKKGYDARRTPPVRAPLPTPPPMVVVVKSAKE
eukprot:CAMPEP_0167787820 /NCGR_PEP_ID=MMETSP0111_2-20121227/9660_1 /TAXON_ID=91324 /ORGANISM="Lotharella globosa, Strain CCCM811" /LENGTH=107 /DNA_ID=CAMNT_0007679555 /DNA_START=68 /DNA_END=391 /DNA_ORIENTATION=+